MSTNFIQSWLREMGAISRGMLFIEGNIATPLALDTAERIGHVHAPAAATASSSGRAVRSARLNHLSAIAIAIAVVATALLAVASLPQRTETGSIAAAASGRIVELPAVSVRPAPEDAAYYQARKIVELPVVTVHLATAAPEA